ncbi:MAG: 50S ribosomal protein L19 [Parcubacteria group bacterium GW2011_GWD2_43_10]|uniref:50S ribosomal protein L19 n=1 Tax=Candidatus Veblenbacteria bacterium RIFOXYC2_FULL_42_11 TaxID=1802428 RepID=A0A1G2QA17_9BACT|nr:MAG: 50S ribosomal protein L19 [Parcubacteria group bacterium GW2011_GWD2_43_10]OHA57394.1 MAG: 50S ribosomal protein L19 [Candidatus Veblenbacteria bacterium RIFOXYC2_FULL_42_11]HAO81584.1 50S ribosomal protein L19 [Candidatus Veblenbacteria bacterium]HBH16849.1 50S ribosomal protein L19 [Candidatus Veblenbacteria bacterium]HCM45668.1 50S ribosomal protein L19 [Candidatus Veblenbacteria bacterium]
MSQENKDKYNSIKPGQVVKVHQKIKELNAKGEEKERIQIFEGVVLAKRGGNGTNSTITVRKVSNGIGVERIFPLQLPTITAIEVVKQLKVRRAKLYYMRDYGKKIKEVADRAA